MVRNPIRNLGVIHTIALNLVLFLMVSVNSGSRTFADYIWEQKNNGAFPARDSASEFQYNGEMWIGGGWANINATPGRIADVWKSSNGYEWSRVDAVGTGMWSARNLAMHAVHNNRMWIMGGSDGVRTMNDGLSSSNGPHWQQMNATGVWTPRTCAFTLAYNNQLFVMG